MAKEIQLTRGLSAIVSDEDYERIAGYKWHAVPKRSAKRLLGFYAARKTWPDKRTVYMHREIVGDTGPLVVDHINGNGLDNRRENIRLARRCENSANKSVANAATYRGVYKHGRKWRALVGRNNYVGSFDTPEEAARAYDEAAKLLWGNFARLNFP